MTHDQRWSILMIVAIAAATTLPTPFNVIQAAMCGLSLGIRIPRMFGRL
jgi:hypothetical protein